MSLSIPHLDTVKVMDERLNVSSYHPYAVYKGGKNVSWKPVTSTSFSNSSIQISAPPPNPNVFVDRQVLLQVPVNFTFNATIGGAGARVLDIGQFDALRAFPLSQSIDTLTVTINNTQVSINMRDVFSALVRYMNPGLKRGHSLSFTPSLLDQFQNYADWQRTQNSIVAGTWGYGGSNRNPLAAYGVNPSDDMARGGFPLFNIVNPSQAAGARSATLSAVLTEPLFLSPFLFGGEDHNAFVGVQTMDFNITMSSNLGARMWSHMDSGNVSAFSATANIAAITDVLGAPRMLFNYITPSDVQYIPKMMTYPYFVVDRYPSPSVALTPQSSTTVSSNNIQLNTIPDLAFIYARQQNSSQDVYSSDSFAYISNVSLNWNNNAGLLSSATPQDLYQMSRKNGCDLSWAQWSQYVGSVVCLRFGKDVQLGDLECPGLLGSYQLQMDVTFRNPTLVFDNPANAAPNYPASINYALYVVTVSEGIFTITENRSIAQVGVMSKKDVLDSKVNYNYTDADVNKVFYGGDFWSGLKQIERTMRKSHRMGKGVLLGTGDGGKKKGKPRGRGAATGGKLMKKKAMKKLL